MASNCAVFPRFLAPQPKQVPKAYQAFPDQPKTALAPIRALYGEDGYSQAVALCPAQEGQNVVGIVGYAGNDRFDGIYPVCLGAYGIVIITQAQEELCAKYE